MSLASWSPLQQRVLTGILLLAVFLCALFALPTWGWALLMLAVMLLAAYEFGRLLGSVGFERWQVPAATHYRWSLPITLLIAIAVFLVYTWVQSPLIQMELVFACYVLSLLVLAPVPWWLIAQERGRLRVTSGLRGGLAIVGGWLLFCAWLATVQLQGKSPWVLLAVLALMWIADSAAYFAGRAFGRRKLAPQISPGKTWEGVTGAWVAVTVYALALAPYLLPHLSVLQALPVLAQWVVWVALAWLLTVLSIIGDLFESLIKRIANEKDSGHLLPGHGGILDRIDSLLTTVPVAALAAMLLV